MQRMSATDIVISPEDRPGAWSGARAARAEPSPSRPKAKASRWPRLLPLQPLQKAALAGLAAIAMALGGAVLWHSGAPQRLGRSAADAIWALTARAGFAVTEITVTGRGRTGEEEIIGALGLHQGDPILALDLGEARARLEAIPTVRAAAIERRLPGSLHVVIAERRPMALWQHDGAFTLIDRDGHPIPGAIDGFEDLPLMVGDDAPRSAAALLEMLSSEPGLAPRVRSAVRVGDRRWDLRLDDAVNGMEVMLPEQDAEAAWHHLGKLESDYGLTRRHIGMVDLRLPDRMVLKPGRDGA